MIRYLTVEGFDTGIAMGGTEYSMTFENITLLNQNVVGINNTWNLMQFRGLTSTNSVPVLRNNKATANDFRWGIVAIIDGVFNGGDPSNVAIENEAQLYLRNISTTGYQAVLSERGTVLPGTSIAGEYIEPRAVSLFQTPKASLGLPIQDTPTVPSIPPLPGPTSKHSALIPTTASMTLPPCKPPSTLARQPSISPAVDTISTAP